MSNILKKISALLLVPILLWAGAGFSLSRHYCLGMLVEENFYYEAESCGMDETSSSIQSHNAECASEIISDHNSCCDDEWINVSSVQVENNPKGSAQKFENKQIDEPSPKLLKGSFCGEFDQVLKADYLDHGPPSIKGELNPKLSKYLAEIQSYLI